MLKKIITGMLVFCFMISSSLAISKDPSTIYIFDIDGTLTPADLEMTDKFAKWFDKFVKKHCVYLATGTSFARVCDQIPLHIFSKIKGTFACGANQYFENDTLVYNNDTTFSPEIYNYLETCRKTSKYPFSKFLTYLQDRKSMIYFSVVGLDAPKEEKERYKEWDSIAKERDMIVAALSRKFPDLNIKKGSSIGITISPKGKDKRQVAKVLREKYPTSTLIFFGDSMAKNGNDRPLAKALLSDKNIIIIPVTCPDDTMRKVSLLKESKS
jgi:phosphomannomutase